MKRWLSEWTPLLVGLVFSGLVFTVGPWLAFVSRPRRATLEAPDIKTPTVRPPTTETPAQTNEATCVEACRDTAARQLDHVELGSMRCESSAYGVFDADEWACEVDVPWDDYPIDWLCYSTSSGPSCRYHPIPVWILERRALKKELFP